MFGFQDVNPFSSSSGGTRSREFVLLAHHTKEVGTRNWILATGPKSARSNGALAAYDFEALKHHSKFSVLAKEMLYLSH